MIDTATWEKVKNIFSSALELEPDRRPAFVVEKCGGDETLKKEVESWLASYGESEDFISTPLLSTEKIFSGGTQPAVGRRFGNYTIIREIGFGGMGAVYLAKRTDGEFEQQVALKIVRQSISESHMIERFRSERQILASLNHANIAKLLDGGVSESGEPFLAMEYVEGEAITEYVRRIGASLNDTLRLFLKVCSAVSYAHRNLIVHRDIKPGNILVANDGEPKLLDFGLAKLINTDLSLDAAQTQTAFRALTPAYASPEQLRGDPVTTSSDIYSLGIVLYELLTNERPFHFEGKSLDEIIRTVTKFEPSLPSAHSTSGNNNLKLRGDLDNIVLMALRKEPERRYQSVETFADDIERHLRGLPVSARPNTYKYRSSKFVKRHKVGVMAAALILLSLIAGIIVSLGQARSARQEKAKAETINAFLEETLRYADPILGNIKKTGAETTINEVLDEAARRLDSGEFDSSPEVKVELERTVAKTYYGQGKYQLARRHMEQHVILLKGLYGENHPKMLAGSSEWALLLFAKDETAEAERIYRQILPLLKNEFKKGKVTVETLTYALNNFAYLRRTQGDSKEAESLFRETIVLIPQLSEASRKGVATTRSTLASTIADQGRFDDALETAREAVEEYQQRGETNSSNYGFSLTVYGGFLTEQASYAEADSNLREAEALFRKLLYPSNLWVADNLRNQAISCYSQGRYAEAIEKADITLKIYEENFGKHYDHYPTGLIYKGLSLTKLGQIAEGEEILREAVEIRMNSLPKEHFWVAAAKGALGECLTAEKRFAEAETLLQNSFESFRTSQEADSPRLVRARLRLFSLYQAWGKSDMANQYSE